MSVSPKLAFAAFPRAHGASREVPCPAFLSREVILCRIDRTNQWGHLQPITEEHHLGPSAGRSSAVADVVSHMARSGIEITNSLHIVVRNDPVLPNNFHPVALDPKSGPY